ncbi:MAG TPA: isopentenyl-diphosphate Delta-isomerase [Chitinophagaceae bacterium]|nr:isopentenyl-diphosphate Delta-isomerase [Chitinophagaceae bacterium]
MMEPNVILVDEEDRPVGVASKSEAHRDGLLHRAFSVFIFDREGKMLIHQRAADKYHSGGLWTNACCSHPRPGEETLDAARRRLVEELGISADLSFLFSFLYQSELGEGIWEHEFDHVFVGEYEGPLEVNAGEVSDHRYESMENVRQGIEETPEKYSTWFRLAFPKVFDWWKQRY